MFKFRIKRSNKQDYFKKNSGYCVTCDKYTNFISKSEWLRDNYICENCGSLPRERALMHCVEKYYPQWRKLFIHESSPANRGASIKLSNQCSNYIASQFYPDKIIGNKYNRYFNENLEKQSFNDNSFDLVITQDVMEHVFNPGNAFREIARTLRVGGAHIFTVPLVNKNKKSEKCAAINNDGKIVYLKKPEYHGNPIDKNGSLVTMHWGYDICDYIYKTSGLITTIVYINNENLGIEAEYIEILISKKIDGSDLLV